MLPDPSTRATPSRRSRGSLAKARSRETIFLRRSSGRSMHDWRKRSARIKSFIILSRHLSLAHRANWQIRRQPHKADETSASSLRLSKIAQYRSFPSSLGSGLQSEVRLSDLELSVKCSFP